MTNPEDIRRRFSRKENENKCAEDVLIVAGKVEKTSSGFMITMIDGYGNDIEYVYLDVNEQVIERKLLI